MLTLAEIRRRQLRWLETTGQSDKRRAEQVREDLADEECHRRRDENDEK